MKKHEKILVAALYLEQEDVLAYLQDILILKSWNLYPEDFGMKFHAQYPDTNRVIACLCGKRGIIQRGWLSKNPDNLKLSLTDEGRKIALKFMPKEVIPTLPISEDLNDFLQQVLGSEAFKIYYLTHQETEITFRQAFQFWGIPTGTMTDGKAIQKGLEEFRINLDKIRVIFLETKEVVLNDSRPVGMDEISHIVELNNLLHNRMGKLIDNLIRRSTVR